MTYARTCSGFTTFVIRSLRAIAKASFVATAVLVMDASTQAAEYLYASVGSEVWSYDLAGLTASAVANSKQVFVSSNLQDAQGLAFDASGNLLVANGQGSGRIAKFSSAGTFLGNIVTGLSYAEGLVVDGDGDIIVANNGTSRVRRYDAAGNLLSTIGSSASLSSPCAVAARAPGDIYVADFSKQWVAKFNSSDTFVSSVPSPRPFGLAFDAGGNMYVGHNSSSSIYKYDPTGTLIGTLGAGSGLTNTNGLTFDAAGNLYVASYQDKKIAKFDPSGAFQFSWSTGTAAAPTYLTTQTVAVPEPSTYAMALAGLACGGYSVWRRGKRA